MSVAFDSDVNLTVQIGFDSNPFDDSQSFTDISSFVRNIRINRGRLNELNDFSSGSCTLTLSNADNRFNPSNTSSPYFDSSNGITKIQPLKTVKISASYDGSTYVIFFGYLNDIPVRFPNDGADSVVTFTATDAFKIFQSQTIQSVGWRIGKAGFSELGISTALGYDDAVELTSVRVSRLLNSIGFPSSLRDINTGTLNIQQQTVSTNLLTALKECETAENAQFFMASDGKATFRNRDYRLTNSLATNSQATFDNSGSNLPFTNVSLSFDTNEVFNVYEWTRSGGSLQTVADSDSIAKYRPITNTKTTLNTSNANVLSIIQQKLTETSIPIVRIDSLEVNPRQNTSIWTQALNREIGDRITVNITNPDSSTFSDELLIESISHTINASDQTWNWIVSLSPAGSSAWVLGQAKLGEGTRFAYS